MKAQIILMFIGLLSLSCGPGKGSAGDESLLDGSWSLSSITGSSFDGRSKPTIVFDIVKKTVSGKNSCNSYSGGYTVKDSSLSFNSQGMMMTKMFCEGSIEKQYMDALQRTDRYEVADGGKSLALSEGGTILLRFDKH